jgi:type IV pilus assembly protein PilV
MVAVVLLSLGFLAAANMQIQSMRFSQEAYNRSQAYFLGTEMIDRMRANLRGVIEGAYSGRNTLASATDPGCRARYCNSGEIADQDLYHWSSRLHDLESTQGFISALPAGNTDSPPRGEIEDLGNGLFNVVLRWKEQIDNSEQDQALTLTFAVEVPE